MSENIWEYIDLLPGPNGGLTVPAEAFRLVHSLGRRGLDLRQDGAGHLRVSGPHGMRPELSSEDIAEIKRYKLHILALLAYQPPAIGVWTEPIWPTRPVRLPALEGGLSRTEPTG